jgi:hypothetical protein
MNPTMKVDSLAAAQAADSAGEFVAFYQHAQGVAAVEQHSPLVLKYTSDGKSREWSINIQSKPEYAVISTGDEPTIEELVATVAYTGYPINMIHVVQVLWHVGRRTDEHKDESDACAEEVGQHAHSSDAEINFDAWAQNPYTKVTQKSIDEDYVPIGDYRKLKAELAAANKDLEILSIEKGQAREDAENWQLEAEAAYKQVDEAIRRLRQMHRSHSDSVQWYQNAVAQALKSLNALPDKLQF